MSAHPSHPQETAPFDESLVGQTRSGRSERLSSIKDVLGFYPESSRELNEATVLITFPDDPYVVNRHLGEIFSHQNRETTKTKDPSAAVRSVTQEYAGYARTARGDLNFAVQARNALEENKGLVTPFTSLAHVPGLVEPHIEGSARGYGQLVRFHDLANYDELAKEGVDPLKLTYTRSNPDAPTMDRIAKVLGSVRYADGLKLASATVQNQHARLQFWTEQLRAATKHALARPVAQAALRNL